MTIISPSRVTINRGSKLDTTFNWKTPANANADLSGYTIALMEVSDALDGLVFVAIETAATGLIRFEIDWDDDLEAGVAYYCRIQITSAGGDPEATTLIQVTYR
jgi:hypothetical protein